MYFEDHKAIQKLAKSLRLIGFRDFRVYNISNAPSDLEFMNHFWICVPKLKKGLQRLEKYPNCRFEFKRRNIRCHAKIFWKSQDGSIIEINSPLHHYLKLQRKNMDISGEWNSQLSRIVAKDFGILARFCNYESGEIVRNEQFLKEYFIAGIRALGTWGAAWYIDRKYVHFLNYNEFEDIQLLLEVTYNDGRIADVRDVSNETQEYFDNENRIKTINDTIRDLSPSTRINHFHD